MKENNPKNQATPGVPSPLKEVSRRDFMQGLVGALASTAALAYAAAPALSLGDELSWEEFFQKHYKELTPEEKEKGKHLQIKQWHAEPVRNTKLSVEGQKMER